MLAITRPPVPTPYSVSIYPNESLISLLARTSADLGFTSTTTLLGVLKLTERQVLEGDIDTRKLAEFLRVPPEKLGPAVKMIDPEEGVWRFNTLQVPETYIDRQYMRVCPVCIGASKSHLQHWSLRPFPICVDHKVRLLSRCSQCDKAYRWSQIPRFSCECGLNVTQATCKPRLRLSIRSQAILSTKWSGVAAFQKSFRPSSLTQTRRNCSELHFASAPSISSGLASKSASAPLWARLSISRWPP